MGSAPPKEFGPYRILHRLGVGGMAETFVALRSGPAGFEQRVCLKRVLPAYDADPRFIAQFLEEARIGASLRHSNIVGIIDFGEVTGTHFLALELIEGADLRSVLEASPGRRLTPDLALLIATELAQALRYAHEDARRGEHTGVVHRDLSPSNVLVSRAGEVKLSDFGIAKAMRSANASASGLVQGKIPYLAPEQARGEALDGRADLFSLGVVLFECLVGARPFDGANDAVTLKNILDGTRTRRFEAADAVPEPLAEIVDGLLATDRDARTPSADALLTALGRMTAPPPSLRLELGARARAARAADSDALLAATAAPLRATPKVDAAAATAHATPKTAPLTGLADAVREGAPASRIAGPAEVTHTRTAVSDAPPSEAAEASAVTRDVGSDEVHAVEDDATRPSAPPAMKEDAARGAATAGAFASKRSIGVIAAALLLVAGLAFALTSEDAKSPVRAATPPAATAATAPAASAPPLAAAPPRTTGAPSSAGTATKGPASARTETEPRAADGPTEADAAPTKAAARVKDGRLEVRVIPWGHVWLDGKPLGRAPVRLALPPGKHSVGAGFDAPTTSRDVSIRAGRTRSVELTLTVDGP